MEISKKRKRLYEEMNMLSTDGNLSDNMEKIKDIEDYLDLNEWERKLTKKYKGAYSTFEGSPISKGLFQFDMWNIKPT